MAPIVNPEDLAKKQIFLILVSAANMRQRNIELIKEISSLGYHMVVITTNFPYSVLTKLYSDSGIDPKTVSFIDTVTRNSIGSAENIPRVVRYVNNPTNLTDLGIAVTEVLKENNGEKVCILYDSISTMLIYLHPRISPSSSILSPINSGLWTSPGFFLLQKKGLIRCLSPS